MLRRLTDLLIKKPKHKPVCLAPFNNMTIYKDGEIRICCFNTALCIGHYPLQNFEEIWFGAKRKTITGLFLNGTYPPTCSHCLKEGLDINSPDSKVKNIGVFGLSTTKNYPAHIDFMLDDTCNLDCIMCSRVASSSSTNTDAGLKNKIVFDGSFIKQITPFLKQGKFFAFSGGEPFLIPLYAELWEIIRTYNPAATIYIQTNATVLSEKIKRQLEKYRPELSLSIDSLNKETYEKIRRGASFDTISENLNYFLNYARQHNKKLSMRVTPSVFNVNEIPDIVNYCNSHNIFFALSILENPYHLAVWSLPPDVLNQILKTYNKGLENSPDNAVTAVNTETYKSWIALVEKYRDTKVFCEKNSISLLENITTRSQKLAVTLENDILKVLKNATDITEKDEIYEGVRLFLRDSFEENAPLFENKYLFYSYFFKIPPEQILHYWLTNDKQILRDFIREKMKEQQHLFATRSYDRIIDIKAHG
ncbi:MAG: molybdenum cofactor biosynthesis protein A [Bacteroidetes bacterium ADurb.Bin408]|nr:MAG: molybdenum cofactor biosynthesis protein A [Bacteroidetes bacterium ADurb.Bin408]